MDVEQFGTLASDPGTPAPSGGAAPAATPPAAAPEPSYEVQIGGQTQKVTLDELRKGYLRQSDYTRKTQELSERVRFAEQAQQALNEARTFLRDPDRIRNYYQQTFGEQLAQAGEAAVEAGFDPAEGKKMLSQIRDELRSEFAQGFTRLQTESLGGEYKRTINEQVERALSQHQELRGAFGDRAAVAIKQLVAAAQPKSLQEAVALIEEEAQSLASNLKGWATSQLKSTATGGAAPASPLSHGIEPPRSGAPPESAPTRTYKKVSDPELRAQVMADLERIAAGS